MQTVKARAMISCKYETWEYGKWFNFYIIIIIIIIIIIDFIYQDHIHHSNPSTIFRSSFFLSSASCRRFSFIWLFSLYVRERVRVYVCVWKMLLHYEISCAWFYQLKKISTLHRHIHRTTIVYIIFSAEHNTAQRSVQRDVIGEKLILQNHDLPHKSDDIL